MKKHGFKPYDAIFKKESVVGESEAGSTDKVAKAKTTGYDYLLGMAIWSLTLERVEELKRQNQVKTEELNNLLKLSIEEMWSRDLDAVEAELDAIDEWEEAVRKDEEKLKSGKKTKPMAGRKRGAAKARSGRGGKAAEGDEDDEDEEEVDDTPAPPPKKPKVDESNSDVLARLKERQKARQKEKTLDPSADLDDAPPDKKAKQSE